MGDNDDIVATNEAAKNIKAIDKDSVHRICSGQVIILSHILYRCTIFSPYMMVL